MQAQITSRLALVAGLAQRLEFRGLRTVFDKRRTVIHIRNCLRYPKTQPFSVGFFCPFPQCWHGFRPWSLEHTVPPQKRRPARPPGCRPCAGHPGLLAPCDRCATGSEAARWERCHAGRLWPSDSSRQGCTSPAKCATRVRGRGHPRWHWGVSEFLCKRVGLQLTEMRSPN